MKYLFKRIYFEQQKTETMPFIIKLYRYKNKYQTRTFELTQFTVASGACTVLYTTEYKFKIPRCIIQWYAILINDNVTRWILK